MKLWKVEKFLMLWNIQFDCAALARAKGCLPGSFARWEHSTHFSTARAARSLFQRMSQGNGSESHEYGFTGIFIPAHVWQHSELNCTEKCLYGEIQALQSKTGFCWASNRYLGKQLGCTKPAWISELVSKLIRLKLLTSDEKDGVRQLRVILDPPSFKTEGASFKTEAPPSFKTEADMYLLNNSVPIDKIKHPRHPSSGNKEMIQTTGADAPSSDFISLRNQWCKAYEEHFGRKYNFLGGRDGKAIKTLLSLDTVENIMSTVRAAWQRKGEHFWNCQRFSLMLCDFANAWNKIVAELHEGQNRDANGRLMQCI